MTEQRAKQIAFCALQLLRKKLKEQFKQPCDILDVDDYMFSELDIELGELEEIYAPYPDAGRIYGGSCFENEQSPKDYDRKYFTNI